MIFSEIYGAYYNAVAKIIKESVTHPLKRNEIRQLINENAFGESSLNIIPSLEEGKWQLIRSDGTTPIKNEPTMPLTTIQKRWLKSISLDPRIRLFTDSFPELEGVEPLFLPDDYVLFDKYSDGDPFDDETYIKNFRMILEAVKTRCPLSIDTTNRKGTITHMVLVPEYLEYSEKDDKFRLIGSGNRYGNTVNLGRIVNVNRFYTSFDISAVRPKPPNSETVEFELYDKRNALERVMLHFAHFEKEAEKLGEDKYLVKLVYDKDDETEILIRVLSFGPMIKVISPQSFVELIKNRLIQQKSCE